MINVINAIEEKLQAQKDEIFFKDLKIKELREQIVQREREIAELKGEGATK